MSIKLQYANTTLNANTPFKNSTTLFHDASQMRKVEATFNANIPFKNNSIAQHRGVNFRLPKCKCFIKES